MARVDASHPLQVNVGIGRRDFHGPSEPNFVSVRRNGHPLLGEDSRQLNGGAIVHQKTVALAAQHRQV